MRNYLFTAASLLTLATPCIAQNGTNINQAIPVYFGQTVTDTIDKANRPDQVYSIALAKGQLATFTATATGGTTAGGWSLCIEAPTVTTIAVSNCVQNTGNSGAGGLVLSYQSAASATYYAYIHTNATSTTYQFGATVQGTPNTTPNPQQAGCLTGQIDSIGYSLQLIAASLPDTVSIGGTQMCSTCTIKPPAYPVMVDKMERAMQQNAPVSACYDGAGNIFQLKLMHP
jgi:hypothetical protein